MMAFSHPHCHGDAQLPSCIYTQITGQYSDMPTTTGQLSDALKHKLAGEGLLDIEVLLRYGSIRTLRALVSMDKNEKSAMLSQTYRLYDILGVFPSSLKKVLKQLFGDMPQQYMDQGSPWGWQDQWTGIHERLTDPLEDDTYLRRHIGPILDRAKEIIGPVRYAECLRRLKRSDDLAMASGLEAAEALAAIGFRKKDIGDQNSQKLLMAVLNHFRDVVMWRCISTSLGFDSKPAFERNVGTACRHANVDENVSSQITNGYKRTKEALAGGPAIKIRMSPERGQGKQKSKQDAGSGRQKAAAKEPNRVPELFDPMGPNSSDPVLPHPADPADLYMQGPMLVQAPFASLAGLAAPMFQGEKPTEPHSLPPARRSPGPRNRDTGSSLQLAQIAEMMKSITHDLKEIKSQVGTLQHDRDCCAPCPLIP